MKKLLNKNILRSLIFWLIMFSYLFSSYWYRDSNKWYLFEYIGFKVLLQFLLSLVILYFLVPKLLHKKKNTLFVFATLFFIYVVQTLYSIVRIHYFQVEYPEIYKMRPPYILWDRMTSLSAFLNNISWVSFPSIILIAIQHYRDQRDIVELKEQKKTTELNLLKNQLNPHFLFNTLNNLYALALKKSDKTPEVIAKLSEILDYILYQCKDKYVSINKEIELLENYIALEKVRYGNRVEVVFEKAIHNNVNIAPLILLTFVENAFKHGISQELNKGLIELYIEATEKEIVFKLKNSKPKTHIENVGSDKKSIGMQNTEKQLDLLYPNAYQLEVNNTVLEYTLELKLQLHEKV
jgi:two-component system LytT family sensor kinase